MRDYKRMAEGAGLIAFGIMLALTNDFFSSFLVGLGVYLLVKGLGGVRD